MLVFSDILYYNKFGSKTSKYLLRDIADTASNIHEEVNML